MRHEPLRLACWPVPRPWARRHEEDEELLDDALELVPVSQGTPRQSCLCALSKGATVFVQADVLSAHRTCVKGTNSTARAPATRPPNDNKHYSKELSVGNRTI